MTKLIIVMLTCFMLIMIVSCKPMEDSDQFKRMKSFNEQAIQKCLQTGGIPIISGNGGWLQDCRWKCEEENDCM